MSLSANKLFYSNTNYNDASNALINYNNLTGNSELLEHPLSKYARELFFSPNYNKELFDSINWANSLGKYKNQNNLINPLVGNVLINSFENSVEYYNDHKYFGVIPTSTSDNTYWAFYSLKITQSGVEIINMNSGSYSNLIWNSSTLPDHGASSNSWGWQYSPNRNWFNTNNPLWYVETNETIDGTSLTFELINYDQTHTPFSGNFVSASSPNGPWVVRNSWLLNPPLTPPVSVAPSGGYKITSD